MTQPLIKLYRGSQTASLPNELTDGAIYVLAKDSASGEIYIDMHGSRLKMSGGQQVYTRTTAEWNNTPDLKSELNIIYIYSDARSYEQDGKIIYVPGIKIGDGNAYLIDLPFSTPTAEQFTFWNNKVNCYVETEFNTSGNKENLVFTRDF